MLLLLTGCSAGTKKLRFGAAGLGGVYHIFADTFANVLSTENNDFQIDVKTTAGSAANLRLLSEGYIQLAVAQADLLHDAGTAMETLPTGKLTRDMGRWLPFIQKPARSW